MKITLLGSNTYQPQLDKSTSSYLVQIGSDNIVFDFGRGCINQLLKEDLQYNDIDFIFISHIHPDHCSELSSLLHIALAEPPHTKLRTKDLIIYGPIGIKKTIGHLLEAFHLSDKSPEYKVIIKELRNGEVVEGEGWKISCFEVEHAKDISCLCYRIESDGKIVSYSGDSTDCDGLRKCCQNANLAILEATLPKYSSEVQHLSAAQAGKIAKESKVKKLVLTHISPYTHKVCNVKEDAAKFFEETIVVAQDLMKFEL